MDHDRVDADLLEQHDVAGEVARHVLVAHGVAAILDHHDRTLVAPHERQRLDQGAGDAVDRGLDGGRGHRGASLWRASFAKDARNRSTPSCCLRAGRDQLRQGADQLGEPGLELQRQCLQVGLANQVDLREHELERNRGLAEELQHLLIAFFGP